MAASTQTHKSTGKKPSVKTGFALVYLDDNAGEDPEMKNIFLSLYEQVHFFTDAAACLELVESADSEPSCITILVSGKYGHMLVPTRFQPLNQVKDIYVYCMDIARHNQWAQNCDKVRYVGSDISKILQHMQQNELQTTKSKERPMEVEQDEEREEFVPQRLERFKDDNNLHDELAIQLLLRSPDDDGAEDFIAYCQAHQDKDHVGEIEQYHQPLPMKERYQRDSFFLNLNSNDLTQLWTLRWFIRSFHRQLTEEQNHLSKDSQTLTVHYGTSLTVDELDGMKHRVGEIIIFTELLTTYTSQHRALESIVDNKDEERKARVIFEINVDTHTPRTVPYGKVDKDQILFWFGSRYRITKIELVTQEHSYWIIGLSLCSTLNDNRSIQTLYEYYLKDLSALNDNHHAFGRILMYKGLYYQAEKWFETTDHYEELAELAIRQYQCERANQYLEKLPEDSHDANLLRAYANILVSSNNIPKGRGLLLKICSLATDELVRARANIALGFIGLIITQQVDVASDHFTLGNETLCKKLPDIHPDVAKSFIGIGYTHFVNHNIADAGKSFHTALDIQKQALPHKHPDFAKTRNGLGHCLATQKHTVKQALQEFEYALRILIDTFHREYKKHPEILSTKNDIDRVRKGKELHARHTLLDYI